MFFRLTPVFLVLVATHAFAQPAQNVEQLALIDTLEGVGGVEYLDGTLFFLHGGNNLAIMNVRDPTNPQVVGSFHLSGTPRWFLVRDSLVFWGTDSLGLCPQVTVLNVINPADIQPIGQLVADESFVGMCLKDSLLYLATQFGLDVVNVIDPANPTHIGSYFIDGYPVAVVSYQNFLLVSCAMVRGIQLFDASDPFNLELLSTINNPGGGLEPFCDRDIVYLPDHGAGLKINDISDPIHPELLGIFDSEGNANRVAVEGHIAYLADGNFGLRVIDVTDPANCTEVGYYDTPGNATKVTLGDSEVVFVADGYRLGIYRYIPADTAPNEPPLIAEGFLLLPPFPNPFNSSATISYDLARPGFVRLGVYDVGGRLVGTVMEGYSAAGRYQAVWNGAGVGSGNYFVRLKTPEGEVVRKVGLVR